MRSAADDLLQSFRFHVFGDDGDGVDPLQPSAGRGAAFEGGGQAGFQSVTIPEVTLEAVEYREGIFTWTQKYVGPPTVSDVSMMRGVSRVDTAFFDWVINAMNGQRYRIDMQIYHFQRDEYEQVVNDPTKLQGTARYVQCNNCVPTRVKPAADFDSASGEVSLAEVDIAVEKVSLEPKTS